MPLLKTIHIGGITLGKESLYLTCRATKHLTLYELNNWLFDYQYAHGYEIKQLPPLDDWTHSKEDATYWSVEFPDAEWLIWIRSEPIEFT